jgi:hypothetical protein
MESKRETLQEQSSLERPETDEAPDEPGVGGILVELPPVEGRIDGEDTSANLENANAAVSMIVSQVSMALGNGVRKITIRTVACSRSPKFVGGANNPDIDLILSIQKVYSHHG